MAVDALVDEIALDVPDAPLASIRDAVRRAGRELAMESWVWRVTNEPVVVAATTPNPEVEQPLGAQPVAVVRLYDSDGRAMLAGRDYRQDGPRSITFARIPSSDTLYGVLAVAPDPGSMLPDSLVAHYFETLRNGALAHLYRVPRQPWTDAQMAQLYRQQFGIDQINARREAEMGYQGGSMRVQPRKFI